MVRGNIKLSILIVSLLLTISGCAQSGKIIKMEEDSVNTTWLSPTTEKALIVFSRPKDTLSAVQADIIDVSKENMQLVGILASGTKVTYYVDPGDYLFMSAGMSLTSQFLQAQIKPNYTYYVLIDSWTNGLGSGKFSFVPLNHPEQFAHKDKKMFEKTKLVQKNEQSEEWFINNLHNLKKRRSSYGHYLQNNTIPLLKYSEKHKAKE